MPSLADCLDIHEFIAADRKDIMGILADIKADPNNEGLSEQRSAIKAVQQYIKQMEAERNAVLAQLGADSFIKPDRGKIPLKDATVDDILAVFDSEVEKEAAKAPLKSAADHLKAIGDLVSQMNDVLGEEGAVTVGGDQVDENKWQKIKPLLAAAWDHAIAAGKDIAEFISFLTKAGLTQSARPYLKRFVEEQKGLTSKTERGTLEPKQGGLEDGRDKNSVSNDLSVVEREAGVASSVRTAKSGKAIQEQSEETVPGVERGGTRGGELSTPSGQEGVGPGSDHRDSDAERGTHGRGSSGVSDTGRPGGQHSGVGDGTAGGRSGREETGTDEYNGRNHRINPDDEIVPKGVEGKIKANIATIQLLKTLLEENREATEEEKKVLAKYTGWGAFSEKVFNPEFARYADRGYGLNGQTLPSWMESKTAEGYQTWLDKYGKQLYPGVGGALTKAEWTSAKDSTVNAHYTSRDVIQSMWKLAGRLGFEGGAVLEPAGGVGHFFGLMPGHLLPSSVLYGVEKDTISGQIFQKLYPDAKIDIGMFQDSKLAPDNSMDIAITNVPFENVPVTDKKHPAYSGWSLHNYYFGRMLDVVRPGGLVVAITSSWTMDAKSNANIRDYIASKADLVGAIRLPDTAFKANAGTEVVTDIVVLRKKDANPFKTMDFLESTPFEKNEYDKALVEYNKAAAKLKKLEDAPKTPKAHLDGAKDEVSEALQKISDLYHVNTYFLEHPEMVLGKHSMTGSMYAANTYTVETTGILPNQLADAVDTFPENIIGSKAADVAKLRQEKLANKARHQEGTLTSENGNIYLVENGRLIAPYYINSKNGTVAINGTAKEKALKPYMDVRDAVSQLIDLMGADDATDSQLKLQQSHLNEVYDAYVKKFGHFSEPKNSWLSQVDNLFARVDALEIVVEEPIKGKGGREGVYAKADIFSKRTKFPFKEPDYAKDVSDAIKLSLLYRGRIDLPYISRITGIENQAQIVADATQSGLAYVNPVSLQLEDSPDYLSGNVKEKLRTARRAVEDGKTEFTPNVTALEGIQPPDRPMATISFRLGSPWIPSEAIDAFVLRRLGVRVRSTFIEDERGVRWEFQNIDMTTVGSPDNVNRFGTAQIGGHELVLDALNFRTPKITYRDKDGTVHVDTVATNEAKIKQEAIEVEFRAWGKTDEEWSPKIEAIYNDSINCYVVKKQQIPDIDYYPNASHEIELKDHQKIAVARALRESVLLSYGVGTGKTYIYITAAMEMKRIGTATKPVIVVHNSTIDQYAKSFQTLYPGAKVMIPNYRQRSARMRKKTLVSMATGDWDAIVLPQSFFDSIANDPAREIAFVNARVGEMEDKIMAAREEEGDSMRVKQMVKEKDKRLDKLRALLDRKKDEVLFFEKMGIDAILIDEAHAYKKSEFVTKLRASRGIDTGSSQRSTSLMLKAEHVRRITNGKNVLLATGTPISNTMAELWTMLRYVRPDLLEQYGVTQFDNFAGTFGIVSTEMERTPSSYKMVSRFRSYVNGYELLKMFFSGSDVRLTKDAGLKLPKMKNDKPTIVINEQSRDTRAVINAIISHWRHWENQRGKDKVKTRYIPFMLYGLAKKASLDLRLIDSAKYGYDENGKIAQAVKNIVRMYKESDEKKGTQIVFSDVINDDATNSTFNVYNELRKRLVEAGIPATEIIIFNEAGSSENKLQLYKDRIRSGDARIVIGSTQKLGIGVDIAEKMVAAHHLSVPDRPMDIEQRNGRIIRQSNRNEEVEIFQYCTKDSLDAVLFDRLYKKQFFADQVLTGQLDSDTFTDPYSEEQASFAEIAAAASGPAGRLLFRKNELMESLHTLKIEREMHAADVGEARRKVRGIQKSIPQNKTWIETRTQELKNFNKTFPDGDTDSFTVYIKGEKQKLSKDDFVKYLKDKIEEQVKKFEPLFKLENWDSFRAAIKKMPDSEVSATWTAMAGTPNEHFDITLGVQVHWYDKLSAWGEPSQFYKETGDEAGPDPHIFLKVSYNDGAHQQSTIRQLSSIKTQLTRLLHDSTAYLQRDIDSYNKNIARMERDLPAHIKRSKDVFQKDEQLQRQLSEIQHIDAQLMSLKTELTEEELADMAKVDLTKNLTPKGKKKKSGKTRQGMERFYRSYNGVAEIVEGYPISLAGAPGYDFYAYKSSAGWLVIEKTVGAALGRVQKTRNLAIQSAEGALARMGGGEFKSRVDEQPKMPTETSVNIAVSPATYAKAKSGISASINALRNTLSPELFKRVDTQFKAVIDLGNKDVNKSLGEHGYSDIASLGDASIIGSATVYGFSATVEIAFAAPKMMEGTAFHEAFHVATKWLLPRSDMDILLDTYENEEKSAAAFAKYAQGSMSLSRLPVIVRRIFIALKRIFNAIKEAFAGKGYRTAEDIFGDLLGQRYSGKRVNRRKAAKTNAPVVHHGTPHVGPPEPGFPHGRPRLDKMRTGEGGAAFGEGWYSAEAENVAKTYYRAFTKGQDEPSLYKLDIPDDVIPKLLDWDKPLSEQSEYVKKALAKTEYAPFLSGKDPGDTSLWDRFRVREPRDLNPGRIYYELSAKMGGKKQASAYLASTGIPGNMYLDQLSRPSEETRDARIKKLKADIEYETQFINNPPGVDEAKSYLEELKAALKHIETKKDTTHNFVIWDQKALDRIALLERNGKTLDAIRETQDAAEPIPSISKASDNIIGNPHFKEWFNNSKVVDANGKPLAVYHGTPYSNFAERADAINTLREILLEKKKTIGAKAFGNPNIIRDLRKGVYKKEGNFARYSPEMAILREMTKKDFDDLMKKAPNIPYKENAGDVFRYSGYLGAGFYFTADKAYAEEYAKSANRPPVPGESRAPYVYATYLSMQNPFYAGKTTIPDGFNDYYNKRLDFHKAVTKRGDIDGVLLANAKARSEALEHFGYDGVVGESAAKEGVEYVVFHPTQIKSTYNVGTFDETNPDVRFAMAGPKAETADKGLLAQAKEMQAQGESRESIWKKTGWWEIVPGSGEWKWEIDDSALKIDSSRYQKYHSEKTIPRGTMISDILTDKAILNAYPSLSKLPVFISIDRSNQIYGTYTNGGTRMGISITAPTVTDARAVLLHEIQHHIQEKENFARGGNPDAIAADASFTPTQWARQLQSAIERAERHPGKRFLEIAPDKTKIRSIEEAQKELAIIRDINSMSRYRSLTGEAEARLAEKRLNMTPEQKKTEPPWVTLETMLRGEGLLKEGQKTEDVLASDKSKTSASIVSNDDLKRFFDDEEIDDETLEKLKNEEEAYEKTFTQNAADVAKIIKDMGVKGFRAIFPEVKSTRPDTTVWDRIVSLPSHYFEKVPALRRMFESALKRSDNYSKLVTDLLSTVDGGISINDRLKTLRKTDNDAYKNLQGYLVTRDQDKIGYSVSSEDQGKTFRIITPKGVKLTETFDHENTAWMKAVALEGEEYRHESKSDLAAKALVDFRLATHRGFNLLMGNMRKLIDEYERMGKELPVKKANINGETIEVDIRAALAEMGDLRGFYFPRLREPGQFVLTATKEKAHPIMRFYDSRPVLALAAQGLRKKGYTIGPVTRSKNTPEDVFQMMPKVVAMSELINQALSRVKTRDSSISLKDVGLQGEWSGKDHLVVSGPLNRLQQDILFSFGGRRWKQDGSWHFAKADSKLESNIARAIQFDRGLSGADEMLLLAETITEEIATIIQSRGARARMIKRSDTKGLNVWEGYETDISRAVTKYAKSLASGDAKYRMATEMAKAFTGTDVSWSEFKADPGKYGYPEYDNSGMSYQAYMELVDERRIDAREQPEAFRDAKVYMEDMLRNDEAVDRLLGVLKGLAVLKYLGGRLAAPIVNLTALPTVVIGVMNGEANIPIHKAAKHLGHAIGLYTKYRLNKWQERDLNIADDIRRVLDEITSRGWDSANFNKEAIATLKSKAGRGYDAILEYSMLPFGETERLNRGATILGTYLALREGKEGYSEEDLQIAKRVSDLSHGTYGKVNRPSIARGTGVIARIPQSFYVFKTFSHNFILTMARYGFKKPQAALFMALMPAILGGVGSSLLAPLIRAVASAVGFDDPYEWLYTQLRDLFGEAGEMFGRYGLAGLAGINIKGSLEIGMTDIPTSMVELLGAPASIGQDIVRGLQEYGKGNFMKGTEKLLPNALAAPIRAYRESTEGLTTKGSVPIFHGTDRVTSSTIDAIRRAMSFNPAKIASITEKHYAERKVEEKYSKMRSEIFGRFRRYLLAPKKEQTKAKMMEILAMVQEYNERVKEKGVWNVLPITAATLKAAGREVFRPPRKERLRAINE